MERNISLTSRYWKVFELEHINVIQLDKTHQKHTPGLMLTAAEHTHRKTWNT